MKLKEILGRLECFEEGQTIYIKKGRWSGESEAFVAFEPDDGSSPPGADGMEYLLELDLAIEVLEVWSEWRDGREPTLQEKVEAVIHYAREDTYLPA